MNVLLALVALVALVALLLSSSAIAEPPADPCAKSKEETDAFSGEAKLVDAAFLWPLETTPKGSMWLPRVATGGAGDTMLTQAWPMLVKMDDRSVIELHSEADAPPHVNAPQYGVSTQWLLRFPLKPDQVKQLATGAVTAIRFNTGSGDETWESNDGFRKNMVEAFGCAATRQPAG